MLGGLFSGFIGFIGPASYAIFFWLLATTLVTLSAAWWLVATARNSIRDDVIRNVTFVAETLGVTMIVGERSILDQLRTMTENVQSAYIAGLGSYSLDSETIDHLHIKLFSSDAEVYYFSQITPENKTGLKKDLNFLLNNQWSQEKHFFALQDLSRVAIVVTQRKTGEVLSLLALPTAAASSHPSVAFYTNNQRVGNDLIRYVQSQATPLPTRSPPIRISSQFTIEKLASDHKNQTERLHDMGRGTILILSEIYNTGIEWLKQTKYSIRAVSAADVMHWLSDEKARSFLETQKMANLREQRRIFIVSRDLLRNPDFKRVINKHTSQPNPVKVAVLVREDIALDFGPEELADMTLFDNHMAIILEQKDYIARGQLVARGFIESEDYVKPYHDRFERLWDAAHKQPYQLLTSAEKQRLDPPTPTERTHT